MPDDLNSPSPAQAPSSRPLSFREDCWSEDATSTLVDAWGRRYLELNRGNLRQKDWQEVADFVNARHGHTKKSRRTDVQCKNRIDTLKKKYKVEKARVSESNGLISSNWPFYSRLDLLIGSAATAKKSSSSSPPIAVPLPYRKPPSSALSSQFLQPLAILPQKRPLPVAATVHDSYFRRNYSAVAAAAAAAEEEGSEDEESLGTSDDEGVAEGEGGVGVSGETDSMKHLAWAIKRFGEIYERVEGEKQKQMVELEKQRMQFTKDLEVQRMQLLMDTQVQLEKIKQVKRTASDDDVYIERVTFVWKQSLCEAIFVGYSFHGFQSWILLSNIGAHFTPDDRLNTCTDLVMHLHKKLFRYSKLARDAKEALVELKKLPGNQSSSGCSSDVPLLKEVVVGFKYRVKDLKEIVLKDSVDDGCQVVLVSAAGGCGKYC